MFYSIIISIKSALLLKGGMFMEIIVKEKTCCFFGHRKIDETEDLKATPLWKWLSGKYVLNDSQTEKVKDFLNGKC